jgi:DNA-binding MarR family transcriptional regulator
MPNPLHDAATSLVAVAPLLSRWLERLLAGHAPPLSAAQYEALRAVAAGDVSAAELARRSGVSGPAMSQLLGGLVDAGLLQRGELAGDRRRHALTVSPDGARVLRSADALLTGQLESLLATLRRPEADALARALPFVEAGLAGTPPPRRPKPPSHPKPPGRSKPPGADTASVVSGQGRRPRPPRTGR